MQNSVVGVGGGAGAVPRRVIQVIAVLLTPGYTGANKKTECLL